ncbi:hypothetical protein ISCGN_029558 [Ixodes scapularis]
MTDAEDIPLSITAPRSPSPKRGAKAKTQQPQEVRDEQTTPPAQDQAFTPPAQNEAFTPPAQDEPLTPPAQPKSPTGGSGVPDGTTSPPMDAVQMLSRVRQADGVHYRLPEVSAPISSQGDVGRQALGCHGAVATEAVQGDLGWSSFEAREASSKIAYDGRLRLMDRCRWAKRLFIYTNLTGLRTRWQKRLYQLQHKYGFFSEPVDASTETLWTSEVRKRVPDYETQQWLQDAQKISTLGVYLANKKTIASEVRLYDNSLGSPFLFEARAGALRTLCYRRRFDNTVTSTTCRVCGVNAETVEHIVLDCARLELSRSQDNGPRLPKPLALAEALGFTDSEIGQFTAVCPATGLVADTKRRLEDWWQKIHLRVTPDDFLIPGSMTPGTEIYVFGLLSPNAESIEFLLRPEKTRERVALSAVATLSPHPLVTLRSYVHKTYTDQSSGGVELSPADAVVLRLKAYDDGVAKQTEIHT